jgi:hypothetical protein
MKIFANKLLAVFVVLSTISLGSILLANDAGADEVTQSGLTFSLSSGAPYEATVTGQVGNAATIVIPSSVSSGGKTYAVTSLGWFAFGCNGCTLPLELTSITIPNSVTSIGDYAFSNARKLTSITIPNSVTSIGYFAFGNAWGLTSITIPASVTSLSDSVFYGDKSLVTVTLPIDMKKIPIGTFYAATSLTSITIPDSVTSIEESAFKYCTALTSITVPSSVTSIGDSAFYSDSSLTSVSFSATSSLSRIGTQAFAATGLKSIAFPPSITSIGAASFEYSKSLTSITIPKLDGSEQNMQWLEIGAGAFSGLKSKTKIVAPLTIAWRDYAGNVYTTSQLLTTATSHSIQGRWSPATSIKCLKGSSSKKITAVNPVCPAGYKKK